MNNNMTASMPKGDVAYKQAETRSVATDRSPAASESRQKFADKLSTLEKRGTNNKGRMEAPKQEPRDVPLPRKVQSRKEDTERNRKGFGDDTQSMMAANIDRVSSADIRGAKLSFAPVNSLPEYPAAHLEKIAAAIQELSGKGVNAEFTLNLPLGPTHAQSVILGRDVQGRIMLQIISATRLPDHIMTGLSADLSKRLQKKLLRVGEVRFSKYKVQSTSAR
jgi:hypothetical protein